MSPLLGLEVTCSSARHDPRDDDIRRGDGRHEGCTVDMMVGNGERGQVSCSNVGSDSNFVPRLFYAVCLVGRHLKWSHNLCFCCTCMHGNNKDYCLNTPHASTEQYGTSTMARPWPQANLSLAPASASGL